MKSLFMCVFNSQICIDKKSNGLPEWCLLHDLLAAGGGGAHILLREGHGGSVSASGASAWPPEGRVERKVTQESPRFILKGRCYSLSPLGLLMFHAISNWCSKGCECEQETEEWTNELLQWWTAILASLRCSALPHEAERLCPPTFLLPRVSSAQELGVLKKYYSVVNDESSVLSIRPLGGCDLKKMSFFTGTLVISRVDFLVAFCIFC